MQYLSVTLLLTITPMTILLSNYIFCGSFNKRTYPRPLGLPRSNRSLAKIDKSILISNRIPKSGSTMITRLIDELSKINNFSHEWSQNHFSRQLTKQNQVAFLNDITDNQSKMLVVSRHMFFLDFREFGQKQPLYFNIVRDPVDKFVSRFYYNRNSISKFYKSRRKLTRDQFKDWLDKDIDDCIVKEDPECMFTLGEFSDLPEARNDLSIPYYCGQWDGCRNLESEWALSIAKENIEAFFPVVGVLEHWNQTIEIMESKLPQFFRGLKKLYHKSSPNILNSSHESYKKPSEISRQILKSRLKIEYELYDFCVQKLKIPKTKVYL